MRTAEILKQRGIDQNRIIYDHFKLKIAESGQKVSKTYEAQSDVELFIGVQIIADRPLLSFYRGFFELELNRETLYPSGHHARNLMAHSLYVGVDQRYTVIDRPSKDGRLIFNYQDKDHKEAPFTPYEVSLYMMLSLKKARYS